MCVLPGKAAPCLFLTDYLHVLKLQCDTTDGHSKCTDDVATEMCKICSSYASCIICRFSEFDHLLEWHSTSTCFDCLVCFAFNVSSDLSVWCQTCHCQTSCVCLCSCHFMGVNRSVRQCSQSESWMWPLLQLFIKVIKLQSLWHLGTAHPRVFGFSNCTSFKR